MTERTKKLSERIQTLMDNEMYGNWAKDLILHAQENEGAMLSREEAQLCYSALHAAGKWAHPDQLPKVAKLMTKLGPR